MQRKVSMKLLKAMGAASLATFVLFIALILVANFVAFLKVFIGSFWAVMSGLFLILFICFTVVAYEN